MQAVCASETWTYLHVLYKKNAFDDFSFHFFVREFSNCNIMFAETCATTQFYSVESTFSTLMSGDVQTIETIYLNLVRITWTVKSIQVWRHLINLESSWKNTLTREVSSEIYVRQYFKTKIQKSVIALK